MKFSRLASISSFWRPTVANRERPRLIEGCGECGRGVGPEGVRLCISGVISGITFRFGEEVFGPVACLLLLTVVGCHSEAGGFLMAPDDCLVLEHHMDPAAFAIFDRLSAFVTSSSALAFWTRSS